MTTPNPTPTVVEPVAAPKKESRFSDRKIVKYALVSLAVVGAVVTLGAFRKKGTRISVPTPSEIVEFASE